MLNKRKIIGVMGSGQEEHRELPSPRGDGYEDG